MMSNPWLPYRSNARTASGSLSKTAILITADSEAARFAEKQAGK